MHRVNSFILAFKTIKNNVKYLNFASGHKASFSSNHGQIIGHTNLLVEEAPNIRELPIVIRLAPDLGLSDIKTDDRRSCTRNVEEEEMIDGFERCTSLKSVGSLLELIPEEEMTAKIAVHALRKIIKLESNNNFRKMFQSDADNDKPGAFIRHLITDRLVDFIIAGDDPEHVLQAIRVISKNNTKGEATIYQRKLTDDILIRILDNEMNLEQVLESVKILVNTGNEENIDRIWGTIIERESEINECNIATLFTLLPYFTMSREFILKTLVNHVEDVWFKLDGQDVMDIIFVLNEIQYYNTRLIQCLTSWLKMNINEVSEDVLMNIVKGYTEFTHPDGDFTRIIARHLKRNCRKIKNSALIGSVMDYCNAHKIRSCMIFEKCSEYFMNKVNGLSPELTKSIVLPFGLLDFQPSNALEFWSVLEKKVTENFIQFSPDDILDIMFVYIYLGKYPDYLVKKIFHPYFLNRVKSIGNPSKLHSSQMKMKIIDLALTLEYESFCGPRLAVDSMEITKTEDIRIKEIRKELVDILPNILDSNVAAGVVLKKSPIGTLYVIDLVVQPNESLDISCNRKIAFLIHTSDHYDSSGQFLIGSQVMKKRHLNLCGFKTVDLNYDMLRKLLIDHSELKKYIWNEINNTFSYFPNED
ncbi:UNVERIFIED_CONTAM: hypothetical protein PYX00_000741 [Menopon gallinae]|uniref:RAP domain-containing protein n=1 Tax=Menopon gallinae TaxID=328185 RepID=A0AAW2I9U3_9NEOP